MRDFKNSAAGAATPDSAKNVCTMGTGHEYSLTHIPRKTQLEKLLSLLPEGRKNAISMQALSDRMDLNPRALRAAIMQARDAGEIIAGDTAGYYIPADKEELRKYCALAKKRSLSGLKALKAARKKLAEIEGQQAIGDGEA